MTDSNDTRIPRDLLTRSATSRPAAWKRPDSIPNPDPRPGWVFKWFAEKILGENNVSGMHKALSAGWVAATIEDCPELGYLVTQTAQVFSKEAATNGHISYGGLILMKLSAEGAKMRTEAYQRDADRAMQAVDETLMSQSDPRMPLFKDRKTETSYGTRRAKKRGGS